MQARDRAVDEWFSRISSGQVQLPRFQRFEAWGNREVQDLLETVLAELPAGATLVLEVGDNPLFKYRPLQDAPEGPERLTELLLDGQQRLTALWRSLNDSYEDRTFFVEVVTDGQGDSARNVVSERRYWKDGQRYPLWSEDAKKTLERGYLPLRLLRPGEKGSQELNSWLKEATEGNLERYIDLLNVSNELRSCVSRFNLPYLFLAVGTKKPVVLDVFVKMNTRSVRLTAFDIVVAEVEGETGESLHDLVASLNGQVPALARYSELSDIVLGVAALLQDRAPNQSGYFGVDWSRAIADWEVLVVGAKRTAEFLEQEHVLDEERLPSRAPIAPLIALWAYVPEAPDLRGNARTLLKRYLWRSFFTERYEKAAATAALQDYRALLPAVRKGEKEASPPIFEFSLPDADEIYLTSWPRKRDRLARAVLLLSFQGGARDLADGWKITPHNVLQREYHHLFPAAYLEDLGIEESKTNNALNCALVTWRTNRTIAAKQPVDYLLERAEASALGEEELRDRLQSHAIPHEAMVAGDYEDFLLRRALITETAAKTLCAGRDWTPLASVV